MMFLPPALAEPFLPRLIDQPEPEDEEKVWVPLHDAVEMVEQNDEYIGQLIAEIRELKSHVQRLKKDRDVAERQAALTQKWKDAEALRQWNHMPAAVLQKGDDVLTVDLVERAKNTLPPVAPNSITVDKFGSQVFLQGGRQIGKTAAQSSSFLRQYPSESVTSEKAQALLEEAMVRYQAASTEWSRTLIEEETYKALWPKDAELALKNAVLTGTGSWVSKTPWGI